jgi:hypothetical protein
MYDAERIGLPMQRFVAREWLWLLAAFVIAAGLWLRVSHVGAVAYRQVHADLIAHGMPALPYDAPGIGSFIAYGAFFYAFPGAIRLTIWAVRALRRAG